jgi:hypothetical protein
VNTRHPAVIVAAVILGVAFIALGIYYWVEPAGSLASFIPGYEAGSGHHHVKHGIAAFLLGAALLVFAWFQTGGGKKQQPSDT